MTATKEKIEYGKHIIEFTLRQEPRASLAINVLPNSLVSITAPINKSKEEILKKIQNKAKWITKQQEYFQNIYKNIPVKTFVSGETFLYLGRQYRLKVIDDDIDSIKLKNGYIVIHIKDRNFIKNKIDTWYKLRLREKIRERFKYCFELFHSYNINAPTIKIRKMRKRWGSYSNKTNTININIECIKANTSCLDYILIHELCHCIYYSHNKEFYNLLNSILPEWKKYKTKLETLALKQ